MVPLTAWLSRWNLPPQAVTELYCLLGTAGSVGAGAADGPPPPPGSGPESSVQNARVLQAAKQGIRLWRNNSGAFTDETGRLIRFGLGNTSAQINKVIKSSDLIGITPVIVTLPMVGQQVGIFTAEETKRPGWKLRPGDDRAQAQWRFGKLVLSLGGIFRFVTEVEK
jgi:hypothetical protein